jgi:hypothetical protein
MALLILGAPLRSPDESAKAYSGTDRDSPLYQEQFEPDHPVNRAALAYGDGRYMRGYENPDSCLDIIRLYREHVGEKFELFEARPAGESQRFEGEFLGWDVSQMLGESHIWNGLCRTSRNYKAVEEQPPWGEQIGSFVRLMDLYFLPRLNENKLFDHHSDALFYLKCHEAIEDIQPGSFEYGDFEVVGIYRCQVNDSVR